MEQTNSLVLNNQFAVADPNTIYHSFSFEDIIEMYLNQLDVKPITKSIYNRALNRFSYYLNKRGLSITEVNRAVILDYKTYLLTEHSKYEEKVLKGTIKNGTKEVGLSSRTIGLYLSAIKSLFKFLKANGCPVNPTEDIKAPKVNKSKHSRRPLSIKQTKEIIKINDNSRDKAIRLLLVATGLRTIEVQRANVGDLNYIGDKRVLHVRGKGRDDKDNFVIISKSVNDALSDYLISRNGAVDSEPLFKSRKSKNSEGRLSTRAISRIIKSNLKSIGLIDNSFTAHSLRHTAGCNILRANGTIEQVQQTLRHSDISTSQIYVGTMDEERRLQNSGEDLIESLITS